jgi:hypothetical protein
MPLSRPDFPAAFNGRFKPALTRLRCPICRSASSHLTEVIDATTTWSVVDGKLNVQDGVHEPGYPQRVQGDCGCGHRWTIRGARSINGAITELDPETLQPST